MLSSSVALTPSSVSAGIPVPRCFLYVQFKVISFCLPSAIYTATICKSHCVSTTILPESPAARHHTQWAIFGFCLSSIVGPLILVLISSHLVFSAMAEIIFLPERNFSASSILQIHLDRAKHDTLSGSNSLSLFLWWINYWVFGAPTTLSGSGRALNGRQTFRHPLATLKAIRLVSFLQQGALDQGLIIICLDKILICLMNLALREYHVQARTSPQDQSKEVHPHPNRGNSCMMKSSGTKRGRQKLTLEETSKYQLIISELISIT